MELNGTKKSQQYSLTIYFLQVSTELINLENITPHATHTSVSEAMLYVRKDQPDGMAVAEIQSRDDLPEELPGLFGSKPALLHQVVKQLSSRHMLQHQVPVGIRGQCCDSKLPSLHRRPKNIYCI